MAPRAAATSAASRVRPRCAAGPSSLRLARTQSTVASHPPPGPAADTILASPRSDGGQEIDPAAASATADRDAQRQWRNTLAYLSSMGSTQTPGTVWKPALARLKPPSPREVTMAHLLAATAHVGHSTSRLAKFYQPWIYGTRHGIAQIDVEKATLPALRRATKVVRDIVLRDGVVLIVGTHAETQRAVVAAAKRMGPNGFHVTVQRWMPGLLTNAPVLLSQAISSSLADYEAALEEDQEIKEHLRDKKSISVTKLGSQLLQPDLVIVLNPKTNFNAIREATANSIPTIGIIDTDVDPRLVTYPIPANDESVRVQELIVGVLSKAGEEGRLERLKLKELHERTEKRERRARRREEQQQTG